MIKINLLPFRAARRKENIRKQLSIFLLSLFLVLILMIVYHFNLSRKVNDLNAEIADTKSKLVTFDRINKEIATIKEELERMNSKIDVIQTLQLNRKAPVQLLDAMTQIIIPKRMWFTHLEEKKIEEKKVINKETLVKKIEMLTIDGLALDNNTVADFMTRLEASDLFSSVDLVTLQQDKRDAALNLKSFQIICQKAPLVDEAKTEKQ